MCVCVCMCIHACICTYICVFIWIWMYVCECMFIHVYYNIGLPYLLIVSVLWILTFEQRMVIWSYWYILKHTQLHVRWKTVTYATQMIHDLKKSETKSNIINRVSNTSYILPWWMFWNKYIFYIFVLWLTCNHFSYYLALIYVWIYHKLLFK